MTHSELEQVHADISKLMADTMRMSEASRRFPFGAIATVLAGAATALLLVAGVAVVVKLLAA